MENGSRHYRLAASRVAVERPAVSQSVVRARLECEVVQWLARVCPSMRLLDVVCLVVLVPAVALAVKAPLSYRNVTSTRVKKRTGAWICDV